MLWDQAGGSPLPSHPPRGQSTRDSCLTFHPLGPPESTPSPHLTIAAHTYPSCSSLPRAGPGLCSHLIPRTKGTFDILCPMQTHVLSVGPARPCSWDRPPSRKAWGSSLRALHWSRETQRGEGRRGLKGESQPPQSELAGRKPAWGGGEGCQRGAAERTALGGLV